MEKTELIKKAYLAFSGFSKPDPFTKYSDLEDAEFNLVLGGTSRRSLSIEQIGTVGWGPISSMNPEALAYFMPRFIELAVNGVLDSDGEVFYSLFINSFHKNTCRERFRLFEKEQTNIMAETFGFLCRNYQKQLEFEGWLKEARQAALSWRSP